MKLTPAIKGQLTKAVKQGHADNNSEVTIESCLDFAFGDKRSVRKRVTEVFNRFMPREQAKHATRRYLLSL